jgi:hypothetical protein
MEFMEDGRPIVFLSSFMAREDPVFALQVLKPLLDVVEQAVKPVKEEAEALRALQMKAALITNLLRSHAQIVAKHKNSLVSHKKRLDTMFTEFQGYLVEAEAQLQALLRVAMGGEEDAEKVQGETEMQLNAIVFRKGSLSECGDEKVKEFVKWLLGHVEVREGVQVDIKDLIEKARVAGYAEKWVRGLREDLFQETAWSKGARYILGLRWAPGLGVVPAAAQTKIDLSNII